MNILNRDAWVLTYYQGNNWWVRTRKTRGVFRVHLSTFRKCLTHSEHETLEAAEAWIKEKTQ